MTQMTRIGTSMKMFPIRVQIRLSACVALCCPPSATARARLSLLVQVVASIHRNGLAGEECTGGGSQVEERANEVFRDLCRRNEATTPFCGVGQIAPYSSCCGHPRFFDRTSGH